MADGGVRVVVVADDQELCALLTSWLEQQGYVVSLACGIDALALMANGERPLCVLLDLHLPGTDGFELARAIRSRYGPRLVIVAFSGLSGLDIDAPCAAAGIDYLISKPIRFDQLDKISPRVSDFEMPSNQEVVQLPLLLPAAILGPCPACNAIALAPAAAWPDVLACATGVSYLESLVERHAFLSCERCRTFWTRTEDIDAATFVWHASR